METLTVRELIEALVVLRDLEGAGDLPVLLVEGDAQFAVEIAGPYISEVGPQHPDTGDKRGPCWPMLKEGVKVVLL